MLLPLQAEKNRVIYAKAEQYAASLTAGASLPLNAEVDDAFTHNANGVRFWRSRPGGCQDLAFEASSDQLVLGFWDNGSNNAFNTTWWHCYAYPSGKTTLQLSTSCYLKSEVGAQVLAYFLIVLVAGLIAWFLRSFVNDRSLSLGAKAIWFAAVAIFIGFYDASLDYSDDEFYKMPDYLKWFDLAYRESLGSLLYAITLFFVAWGVGKAIALLKNGSIKSLRKR